MKKQCILFIALLLSFTAISQEKTKQKEVGIIFQNLDNFGLTYKTGSESFMWRFNTMVLTGAVLTPNTFNDDTKLRESVFGFNVSLGAEKRKLIGDNFEFRTGLELFTGYSHTKTIQEIGNVKPLSRIANRNYGLNFVLGANYLKNNFVFGVELLPFISYSTRNRIENSNLNNEYVEDTKTKLSSGYSYGISNSSARLTVAYRF